MAFSLGEVKFKCIKYLLFTFNLFFVISGVILIIIGSVIKTPYGVYHYILDHGFFAIPVLLIFIGIIIFIVSFLGCCGAFKENYYMTVGFIVALLLILILEISGGIAGYVLKDKVSAVLKKNLDSSIAFYNTSRDVSNLWDIAQSNFHCCGANSMNDWNGTLPASCCPDYKIVCEPSLAFNESCYEHLENFFKHNAGTLGGAGIGISLIQIAGIAFAYNLATSIGKHYESLDKK